MVMATFTPQCIGREFVRQYYTMLHKDPTQLHRFYMKQSLFTHGKLLNETPIEPIVGQEAIHAKIMQRDYKGCHSRIISVDSQQTINGGVVVQVTGELSIRGMPKRTFTQTFVLEAEAPKKYFVYNDIFRYQDEEVEAEEQGDENAVDYYSADEEEVKDESAVAEYDQKTTDLVNFKAADPSNAYADQESPTMLTNGGSLVEDEESNDEIQTAVYSQKQDVDVDEAKPQNEVDEMEAPPFLDAGADEKSHEDNAATLEEEKAAPSEPEGPPEPVSWAAFVKKTTPAMPPQSNNAAPRQVAPKVSPQQAVQARPQRRQEDLPRRDFRDVGRRKFAGAPPDNHQIFIGNLPSNISEADVRSLFKGYGNIVEVRLNAKNFGFVAFDNAESAERILKQDKPIIFGKFTINVEEKRTSGSGGPRGGARRDFGRPRNDSGPRAGAGGGRPGPAQGNRDRPRGGPGGQQKPRGGMNSGEGKVENARGLRNRDRGGPVGGKR